MNEYKANEHDQKKAENICRQYISREGSKIEQLQKLDSKVKVPGKVIACILGIAGALIMGSGMSFVMVWGNMTMGLALGVPGMAITLLAYPVYALITNSRKKKYAAEIIRLSAEINR